MISAFSTISVHGLSLERLKTFCLVASEGSIAGAAPGNPTQQSQYSRQIKELEEGLGTRLFTREGRKWRLTPEGRKLALLTRAYFQELGSIAASDQLRELRIGAGESVMIGLLLPRYGEFKNLAADVRFSFRCMPTSNMVGGLIDGSLDFAVIRDDAVISDFGTEPLGSLDFRLVVPRILLRERMAASFELLGRVPLVMLSGDGRYVEEVQSLFRKLKVTPNIAVYVQSFPQMAEIIKSGDNCGIMPTWHAAQFSEDRFAVVTLKELQALSRKLVLAFHAKNAVMRPKLRSMAKALSGRIR